jgi:hypothetical protein
MRCPCSSTNVLRFVLLHMLDHQLGQTPEQPILSLLSYHWLNSKRGWGGRAKFGIWHWQFAGKGDEVPHMAGFFLLLPLWHVKSTGTHTCSYTDTHAACQGRSCSARPRFQTAVSVSSSWQEQARTRDIALGPEWHRVLGITTVQPFFRRTSRCQPPRGANLGLSIEKEGFIGKAICLWLLSCSIKTLYACLKMKCVSALTQTMTWK